MAINISDSGSTILISITADYSQSGYPTIPMQERNVEKTILNIKAQGDQVVLFDGETHFSFLYTDITSPAGGTAIIVKGLIEAFKDAASSTTTIALNDGATSNTSTVAASVTAVTLQAANSSRVKVVVYNDDSAATLYVKEGITASSTSFSYKLLPGDTLIIDDYTGIVTGAWTAATGSAKMTETV